MSEAEVMDACFDYLIWQGFLVMRLNSGAATPTRKDGTTGFVMFNYWQVLGQDKSFKGASDLLAFRPDLRLIVEAKRRPGIEPTPAQLAFIQAWIEHGGVAVVASSIDDLRPIVEGQETR